MDVFRSIYLQVIIYIWDWRIVFSIIPKSDNWLSLDLDVFISKKIVYLKVRQVITSNKKSINVEGY